MRPLVSIRKMRALRSDGSRSPRARERALRRQGSVLAEAAWQDPLRSVFVPAGAFYRPPRGLAVLVRCPGDWPGQHVVHLCPVPLNAGTLLETDPERALWRIVRAA